MAASLSDIALILSRVLETVSRLEGNQQTLISKDVSAYHQISSFLMEVQREIALISTRQMHISGHVDRLTHIEALLDSVSHLLRHVTQVQSGQQSELGKLSALAQASQPPKKPLLQYAEKAIALAKLIGSNWGAVTAMAFAAWAWGVPYLRQLFAAH